MNTRSIKSRVLALLVTAAFVAPMFPVAAPSVALAETPLSLGKVTVTVPGHTIPSVPGSSLVTSVSVNTTAVANWVTAIGNSVDRGMKNATLTLDKKKPRLNFKASVVGYKLDRATAKQQIIDELNAELSVATSTTAVVFKTVALKTAVTNPRVTKFGKTVVVSKSQRRIFLYDNHKVIKTYRCAIGRPAYPTPTGTFHIGKKVKNPTWTNGYASWSRNMPAYIGPGPNNPLGTRAMYVYTGLKGGHDTGVRFHGVPHSEDPSIGHAASHGCLRMHRKDVENFFPRVTVGTTVYIVKY
jgi:lipoprotein-anchoring transpeptidase ErfK/SrfK